MLYRELDGSGADEDVASLMSPLNRTVNVVAVPDLLDAARRLTSCVAGCRAAVSLWIQPDCLVLQIHWPRSV